VTYFPAPKDGEVYVHTLRFAALLDVAEDFMDLLSLDEQVRAKGFIVDSVRARFILSHAFCRCVLSGYLRVGSSSVLPHKLLFTAGGFGRPALDSKALDSNMSGLLSGSSARLGFSLSHCDTSAVVAVATTTDVGVDIEECRAGIDALGIANRYFAPQESATLADMAPDLAVHHFTRLWVCKEAFVKAIGLGLFCPLDSFVIDGIRSQTPFLARVGIEYGPAPKWSLAMWSPDLNCNAAIAIRFAPVVVHFRLPPALFAAAEYSAETTLPAEVRQHFGAGVGNRVFAGGALR
jgi:4'-phosphopantetheinyl transferase